MNHSIFVNTSDAAIASAKQRKAAAYNAGDRARDDGTISEKAHRLYERLLVYAGTRDYCWPSQETLAADLAVCVRTIKRYITELVAAKLIARVRRWATSWLTYICTYCSGPSQGTEVSPRSINSPDLNQDLGGGKDTSTRQEQANDSKVEQPTGEEDLHPHAGTRLDTPATRRLLGEGVTETLHKFADAAMQLVERAIRRASAVRDQHDPRRPGVLATCLIRLRFLLG